MKQSKGYTWLPFVVVTLGAGVLLGSLYFLTYRSSLLQVSVQQGIASSTAIVELSQAEYTKAKTELLALESAENPRFALTTLRERMQTNNMLLRSCHALTHEIGRAAYVKYQDFGTAMQYQDEICNSGYLHGIIEAYFSEHGDIEHAMQSVCALYAPGKYLSWECYHGVGHGLMYYTKNDLPKSLALCSNYTDSFARSSCVNGIFMENFNTDQKLHPSTYLKESDPFYPCNEQATINKSDCYLYAPTYFLSLHQNQYQAALVWCESAESVYRGTCTQGVGSQAMKENILTPKVVESICMSNSVMQMQPCIMGMVGLYILHSGSLTPAQALCGELAPINRESCALSIASAASLF